MGMNPFTYGTQHQYPFANKEFIQNCLDYLINSSNLSEAKAKDYTLRLLDKRKVEAEMDFWKLSNALVPVAIIVVCALLYQFIRRRKYTLA